MSLSSRLRYINIELEYGKKKHKEKNPFCFDYAPPGAWYEHGLRTN